MDLLGIFIPIALGMFFFTRHYYLSKIKNIESYSKEQIKFFYDTKSIQELNEKIAKDISEIDYVKFEDKTYYYTNPNRIMGEPSDLKGFTVEDNWYSLSMNWYLWEFGEYNTDYESINKLDGTQFAFYSRSDFENFIAVSRWDYKKFIVDSHKDGDAEYISFEEALEIKRKMPRKPRPPHY